MNTKRYRWILSGIALVILSTIVIQLWWNYKNYLVNKQQLYNDVQLSLDKAVDDYYAQLAEESTLGLSLSGDSQKTALDEGGLLDQLSRKIDSQGTTLVKLDSLRLSDLKEIQIFTGKAADSLLAQSSKQNVSIDSFKSHVKELKQSQGFDPQAKFELLTSKIVISISSDTLDLKKVDSLFIKELGRKSIDVDYDLMFFSKEDRLSYLEEHKKWPEDDIPLKRKEQLVTESKSTFLPDQSTLLISFSNTTKTILNRILSGILISLVLIFAVIATLFYLLKIIQKQKQIAEIKNDLISNITHEFKTPIATIGAALEGIQNFNVIDNKEKTKSYLNMSNDQLGKLNVMVEKLLETASLDSQNLELDLSPQDAVQLIQGIAERFSKQDPEQHLEFNSTVPSFVLELDAFHFENAINNILDNAFKYGGDEIRIFLIAKGTELTIKIEDNGPGIPKEHQKLIFNKFYRIPKGNRHDVKGFGIGLYYSKTIIERHGGNLKLESRPGKTTFKITLNHVDD